MKGPLINALLTSNAISMSPILDLITRMHVWKSCAVASKVCRCIVNSVILPDIHSSYTRKKAMNKEEKTLELVTITSL